MLPQKQASKNYRKVIKRRMLDRGEMTVRELSRLVAHPESTVSRAINHGKFPRVRRKIMEVLNA